MAVAIQATRSKIFTILSPVGLFCDIINLILINNFIILPANIHNYFKNANLRTFYGVFTEFLRSYTLVLLGCAWVVRSFRPGSVPTKEGQRSGLKRGAGGIVRSFRPGSVRRRRAEVRPEAGDVRLVGRAGVLVFSARCVGFAGWKRSEKPKPSPLRWGALDWMEFLGLARCVGKCDGRGQAQKPIQCGVVHS